MLQAVNFLKEHHRIVEVRLPDISHIPLHNIDHSDSFFDSLRLSYPEFDDWYIKISAEGRKAWCVLDNSRLAAILIYKDEFDEQATKDVTLHGKSLKLCTFKVGESVRGRKIGELMVKMAFEHAIHNKHANIYVTIREGLHDHLRDLCEEFGFYNLGICKKNRDEVYVKEVPSSAPSLASLTPFEYYKKYHPFVICSNVAKYIVPIVPEYHQILFPEVQRLRQTPLFGGTSAVGNTIKKAYLCNAQIREMKTGDLVLFYRSTDKKAITTIGIVERFEVLTDVDEISTIVSKRTVYSRDEIEKKAAKEARVMLFRQIKHFENPIDRKWLIENGVPGNIQSIRTIDDEQFQKIMAHGNAENCA